MRLVIRIIDFEVVTGGNEREVRTVAVSGTTDTGVLVVVGLLIGLDFRQVVVAIIVSVVVGVAVVRAVGADARGEHELALVVTEAGLLGAVGQVSAGEGVLGPCQEELLHEGQALGQGVLAHLPAGREGRREAGDAGRRQDAAHDEAEVAAAGDGVQRVKEVGGQRLDVARAEAEPVGEEGVRPLDAFAHPHTHVLAVLRAAA